MTEPTDRDLVAGVRNGDTAAYERLIKRHFRRVFAVCYGILGCRHDAEDATQEALLKGLERMAALRAGGRFAPWITRIARNVCTDHLRRRKLARDSLAAQPPPPAPQPSDNGDLDAALRQLPARLRIPLVMYYFGGRNGKSIADVLNISHSGACSRLRQARAELHRILTAKGEQ